ncbi:MAG: hypothetical protein D6741_02615 [Planctomycetota bacterium]|nr:MAG: hypothetical protein D6741_02615 [Planctomycetota bacterium]
MTLALFWYSVWPDVGNDVAFAAMITKQGVSWDTDWLPSHAEIRHGTTSTNWYTFGSAWKPAGWNSGFNTVGDFFRGDDKDLSVYLGPGYKATGSEYESLYAEVELNWGGSNRGFRNLEGPDLAVYENGYPPITDTEGNARGASEVYLVSLGYVESGTVKWTGYRYSVVENYEPEASWVDNNGNDGDGNFGESWDWGSGPTYLTLLDATEFGIQEQALIVGVRIRNAVYGWDWCSDENGEGWVTLGDQNSDGSLYPFKEENGAEIISFVHPKNGETEYRYDPDITVVVPLHSVVPEPGVFVGLVGCVLATLFCVRRRNVVG